MPKRIITITSGKGGVGKTTLAINLGIALSRYGSTVLIDQDFETGSVRSFLDLPVERDLYHFLTRSATLGECITRLPEAWDPRGQYRDFGLIAAPRHYIEELGTVREHEWRRFVRAVNDLPVDFVLLDMKAGLAEDIVRTMPVSNSGILVFTPQLPAATAAAAYLIKAQIFRKLQLVLWPPSPLLDDLPPRTVARVSDLLHCADDVYDESIPNLDYVLATLVEELGPTHPVPGAIERTLATFKVHYVLNHFDGVEQSYGSAVKPFVENLLEIVSARLQINNLGWVEKSDEIHQANCQRVPAILFEETVKRKKRDRAEMALEEIEQLAHGSEGLLERTAPGRGLDRHLTDQLDRMQAMFSRVQSIGYANHFHYVASSAHTLIRTLRRYNFGDDRLLHMEEVQGMMTAHRRR